MIGCIKKLPAPVFVMATEWERGWIAFLRSCSMIFRASQLLDGHEETMGSRKRLRRVIMPVLFATVLLGCTRDPQILKQRHFDKGQAYFQQAKYAEAAIEF